MKEDTYGMNCRLLTKYHLTTHFLIFAVLKHFQRFYSS